MGEEITLDPRVHKIQKVAKVGGAVAVIGLASVAVIAVGAAVIPAAIIGVVALFLVNFVVPVTARGIALWRQRTLTALTEAFSEETIREDERQEGERIQVLEQQYITSRSELEGAQEELEKQMKGATPDEQGMLREQVEALQKVINNAEETLKQRKSDFIELQRVNKLYVALDRSARAMQNASGAQRDTAKLQELSTARTAIKTRMRAAMAGKTIEGMNLALSQPESTSQVLGSRRLTGST